MKLAYNKIFQVINLKKGLVVIGTNNPIVYTDLSLGLQSRRDCLKLIDDSYHTLPITKYIDYEGNIVDNSGLFDKYKKMIINEILSSLESNQLQKILLKQCEIKNIVEQILNDEKELINIINLCDIKKVFSARNIDFKAFKESNPYDIIKDDIDIHAKFFPNKILSASNMTHYLSKKELAKVESWALKRNIGILDIDFFALDKFNLRLNYNYYIDSDFEVWRHKTLD